MFEIVTSYLFYETTTIFPSEMPNIKFHSTFQITSPNICMEAYKSQEVTMLMKQMTYMFSLTSHSSTSNLVPHEM